MRVKTPTKPGPGTSLAAIFAARSVARNRSLRISCTLRSADRCSDSKLLMDFKHANAGYYRCLAQRVPVPAFNIGCSWNDLRIA